MRVLEVGCGPGTLSRTLARWLGGTTRVTGLDRDVRFVDYARRKASSLGQANVDFVEGDALCLPFPDGAFDACVSHTVVEHVPGLPFLIEQKRVCRDGGMVAALSVRSSSSIETHPPDLPNLTQEEVDLRRPINEAWERKDKDREVAGHPVSELELPLLLERAGLRDVRIDALALPVAMDNPDLMPQEREDIVRSEEVLVRESLDIGLRQLDRPLPPHQERRLRQLVEQRLAERRRTLAAGRRLWWYEVSLTLVAVGVK